MHLAVTIEDEKRRMKKSGSQKGGPAKSESPSRLIDARIEELADWRGEMLARLRALIKEADPAVDGIICTGEIYKNVVKMTFARGAALNDPSRLFNSSLDGNTRRAIDFRQDDTIDAKALKMLIRAAVALNSANSRSDRS